LLTNTQLTAQEVALYYKGLWQVEAGFKDLKNDLAKSFGADWKNIHPAVIADPLISSRYSNPVHKSGRGAGGACFIKDFAAFAKLYKQTVGKKEGVDFLKAAEKKNIMLLVGTNKDMDLLEGVYGKSIHKLKLKKTKK
jgi:UDP-glucose 6-dehydrogenase